MKDLCIIAKTSIHLLPFTKKSWAFNCPLLWLYKNLTPPFNKWGGGGHTKHSRQEKRKRAKLLSYMYKKSHDMDNAMKILDLSFNERRSYLASSVDFFYVPLLILKTILRFSEKRWRWQLKGSYTSLVMWKILPWGTNKINISRFSSN